MGLCRSIKFDPERSVNEEIAPREERGGCVNYSADGQ